jgi:hypothetical protein
MEAIRRRQKMLRSIRKAQLIPLRDACIAELEAAKPGIARFYSDEN